MATVKKLEKGVELSVTLTHDEAIAIRNWIGATNDCDRLYFVSEAENRALTSVHETITNALGGIVEAMKYRSK